MATNDGELLEEPDDDSFEDPEDFEESDDDDDEDDLEDFNA